MTAPGPRILSLYWGFSIGGIAKYASLLNGVVEHQPIDLQHACILSDNWHCDESTLTTLDAERIELRNRADFGWIDGVDRLLSKYRPDLLFTHGFNGHLVALVMRRLRRHRVPSIISYHGLYHPVSAGRRLIGPVYNGFTEYYCRNVASRIVSVTEYSREYLTGKKVPVNRIQVIHNGIPDIRENAGARERIRAEWGLTDNEIVVGAASRLDEVKGLRYLIDAFATLRKSMPELRLVIAGTGSLDEQLRQQANEAGCKEQIVFTGFRSDIADCIRCFDIYALPSLAEYHSIALLEAMRAERPIIATSVGGNTESVRDDVEALVVPPARSDALATAIKALAGDAARRRRLAQAARARYLAEFQDTVMIRRTADWLMDCANATAT